MVDVEDKIQELREATRAANEALTDLKAERKACQAMIDDTLNQVQSIMLAQVKKELSSLGDSINKACKDSERRIFARFDKLAAVLMGEEKKDVRPSLMALAEEWSKQ